MAVSALEQLEPRQLLAAAPVTISVVSNAAEHLLVPGAFRISRAGDANGAVDTTARLTVNLRVGGDATYGLDYTLPTAPVMRQISATIAVGKSSTLIAVTPIDDTIIDAGETVTLTVIEPMGMTYDAPLPTASVTIVDNDDVSTFAPTANAGGPYTVNEGKAINLNGSGTAAGTKTISKYEWDITDDNSAFATDVTGENPVFSAKLLDGTASPGTRYTVRLRVTDSAGVVSPIVSSTVRVLNVPPRATLVGSKVPLGKSAIVAFKNVSDVPADLDYYFIYRYDFNNDGVTDLATHRSTTSVPARYLTRLGRNIVHASISDVDRGTTSYPAVITTYSTGGETKTQSVKNGAGSTTSTVNPFADHSKIEGDENDLLDLI